MKTGDRVKIIYFEPEGVPQEVAGQTATIVAENIVGKYLRVQLNDGSTALCLESELALI